MVGKFLGRKADRVLIVAVNIDRNDIERAKGIVIDVIYGNILEE